VLLGISTGNAVALALIAGVFVVFALLSALVIPRRWPQYPGRGLGWFVAATLVFFVATLGAVEVFAKEEAEEATHGETATETGPAETGPTETEPPGTTTGEAEPPPPPAAAQGDPAAGRSVFEAQGCGGCHTFSAAGTSGTAGPNLDESLEGQDAESVRQSIVDPNAEVASGFAPNVMPQNYGEQLTQEQLDDLVAFLTQG
jgi:mono/diheme cytochrome c family protein